MNRACLIFFFLLVTFGRIQSASAEVVKEILIQGLARIDRSFVASHLPFKVGESVDARQIDRVIEDLFKTRLFEDVSIEVNAGKLTVLIEEKRILNRVTFEGNKKVTTDVLRKEVKVKPRQVYDLDQVAQATDQIKKLYVGRCVVQVVPRIVERESGRVDLVFEIHEGKPRRIKAVLFQGNEAFSDGHLRSVLLTREYAWWRFLSSFDTYDSDRIMYDRELIYRQYLNQGYLDAKVLTVLSELSSDDQGVYLTFKISEGQRYFFHEVSLLSEIPDFLPDQQDQNILPKKGDVVSRDAIEKATSLLKARIWNRGFFGTADFDLRPHKKTGLVTLNFFLKPDKPALIHRIVMKGHLKTNEEIIRRECYLSDGDPVTPYGIEETKRRLFNLDYFKQLDVHLEETPSNKVFQDLLIEVEDKSTGSLMFNAGYNTLNGLFFDITASERNFLGRGQEVELSLSIASKAQSLVAGFSEPYLFGKEIRGGVRLFLENVWYDRSKDQSWKTSFSNNDGYKLFSGGASLSAGYSISSRFFERFRYTGKYEKFRNKSVQSVFYDNVGNNFLSQLGHSFIYDARKNVVNPTEDGYVSLDTDYAGLGGTLFFLMNQVSAAYYYALDQDKDWLLKARSSYGLITPTRQNIRAIDHFFMGGSSVRGFEDSGIGPRDNTCAEAIGGKNRFSANLELSTILGSAELGLVGFVFNDWGSLWKFDGAQGPYGDRVVSNDFFLRGSVGVGLKWQSPFGLIGFSLGWPLRHRKGIDSKQIFRFGYGTNF